MPLLTIKTNEFSPVPAGTYKASFDGVAECETKNGKAYKWRFTVTEGTHKGSVISSLSDREYSPSPKNRTGRFLAALAGASAIDGLAVNTDSYIGKTYLVIVVGDGKIDTFATLPS